MFEMMFFITFNQKTLSPFSVIPIGSGTELDECDSAIVGEWLSLEEIRRQFPDKGKYVIRFLLNACSVKLSEKSIG